MIYAIIINMLSDMMCKYNDLCFRELKVINYEEIDTMSGLEAKILK